VEGKTSNTMKMAIVKIVRSANPFLLSLGITPFCMIRMMFISHTAIHIPTATSKISSLKWRAILISGKFAAEVHCAKRLLEIELIFWLSLKIILVIFLWFRTIAIKRIHSHNCSHPSGRISIFLRLQRHNLIFIIKRLKSQKTEAKFHL